jgi:hypothetical protein
MKRRGRPEQQLREPAETESSAPVQRRALSPAWIAQAQATYGNAYVQKLIKEQLQAKGEAKGPSVQQVATKGVSDPGAKLSHHEEIQSSFGDHDISDVKAHTGSDASQAAEAIGAEAYAKIGRASCRERVWLKV